MRNDFKSKIIAAMLLFIPLALLAESTPDDIGKEIAWGRKVDGLRVGIVAMLDKLSPAARPSFHVTIENVGQKDIVLQLGTMLGNGKKQFADQLEVVFSSPDGQQLILEHNWDRIGFVGGRLDPMLIPLARGCSYGMHIDFTRYWFTPRSTPIDWVPRGKYQVSARFTGKGISRKEHTGSIIPALPYWTGVAKSESIPFTSPGVESEGVGDNGQKSRASGTRLRKSHRHRSVSHL